MKTTNESKITMILTNLLEGINNINYNDCVLINKITTDYLNNTYTNLNTIYEIFMISNILYNNKNWFASVHLISINIYHIACIETTVTTFILFHRIIKWEICYEKREFLHSLTF
jgi:hypothetical protein